MFIQSNQSAFSQFQKRQPDTGASLATSINTNTHNFYGFEPQPIVNISSGVYPGAILPLCHLSFLEKLILTRSLTSLKQQQQTQQPTPFMTVSAFGQRQRHSEKMNRSSHNKLMSPIKTIKQKEEERPTNIDMLDQYYGINSSISTSISSEEAHSDIVGEGSSANVRSPRTSFKVGEISINDDQDINERNISSQDTLNASQQKILDELSKNPLDFGNLNDCVTSLLKKVKGENQERDIKRRQRKNRDQIKVLENEYKKNTEWTREFVRDISAKLGLRECQVYKWHWDQRKKDGLENNSQIQPILLGSEGFEN